MISLGCDNSFACRKFAIATKCWTRTSSLIDSERQEVAIHAAHGGLLVVGVILHTFLDGGDELQHVYILI